MGDPVTPGQTRRVEPAGDRCCAVPQLRVRVARSVHLNGALHVAVRVDGRPQRRHHGLRQVVVPRCAALVTLHTGRIERILAPWLRFDHHDAGVK